jgi:hypothetical protein
MADRFPSLDDFSAGPFPVQATMSPKPRANMMLQARPKLSKPTALPTVMTSSLVNVPPSEMMLISLRHRMTVLQL